MSLLYLLPMLLLYTPRSPVDFAKAKSVAASRKRRLFSFGKSENQRFSADEQCSPLHSHRKERFWQSERAKHIACFALVFCVFDYTTNWNLTTSKQLDFVGNHSHGLFVGVNFNRVECVIHRYSCYTSFDDILNSNTALHILC